MKAASSAMPCGRLALEDPNFRTDVQLKAIHSFRHAAQQMSQRKDRQVSRQLLQRHFFHMHNATQAAAHVLKSMLQAVSPCMESTKRPTLGASVGVCIHCNEGGADSISALRMWVACVHSGCMQVTYSLELAQQYMWAQTDQHIFLAAHVPTGECFSNTPQKLHTFGMN